MYKMFLFSMLLLVGVWLADVADVQAAGTSTMAVATSTLATTTAVTAASTTATTTVIQDRAAVEKRVREYFADTPVMIDIARCESNFRQFTDSGKPFRGGAGGEMLGVFQFYEKYHVAPAAALGFDLDTLEGNIGYAKRVYEGQGTTPWSACVPAVPITIDAQTQLKIELMTKLISLLQQLLAMELAAR
jgi:hypothetical protein